MNQGKLFEQILNPANRHNPYPIYAQLRETPISQQEDGTYVVSTYREIEALLYDPRISSDERKSTRGAGELAARQLSQEPGSIQAFLFLDPPDHNRLRRAVMHHFTHERIEGMRDRVIQIVDELLDAQRNRGQLDIVDDFAHPLPVRAISELMGVSREDRSRLEVWIPVLVRRLEPAQRVNETQVEQAARAAMQMREYLRELIATRRDQPGDDLLSALVATSHDNPGQMNEQELLSSIGLLLGAGYETTVNLIANSVLTLLHHPKVLARLRRDPDMVISTVEEVQRYDPPVQFRSRTTLSDINMAGVTIPKGSTVVLLFASGSRDPARFTDADRFDPDRADNEHFGFGRGIHYCVGAPLARIETHVALSALVRRLANPRLVADPPPYRELASLRGPNHLAVTFDHLL
ncbi:MAG: cytochrome P450 [Candidatus Nitrosopolaris sp.]